MRRIGQLSWHIWEGLSAMDKETGGNMSDDRNNIWLTIVIQIRDDVAGAEKVKW